MSRCEYCRRVVLPNEERVALLRDGGLAVFHAHCYADWSAASRAAEIDRLVAREAQQVIDAAERLIARPPAA